MPSHNTRKIQREIEGVRFLLLFLRASDSGIKEYAADWLENVNKVYRDSRGRFASKKTTIFAPDGSDETPTAEANDKEENKNNILDRLSRSVSDLLSFLDGADKTLSDKEQAWYQQASSEEIKESEEKGKKVARESLPTREDLEGIADNLEKAGVTSEQESNNLKEGMGEFDREVSDKARQDGDIGSFLVSSLKSILGLEAAEEQDKEGSLKTAGKATAAFSGITATQVATGGSSAALNVIGAMQGSSSIKGAFVKGGLGFLGGEAGNLGAQSVLESLPEDVQNERNQQIAGAIGRLAGGLFTQGAIAHTQNMATRSMKEIDRMEDIQKDPHSTTKRTSGGGEEQRKSVERARQKVIQKDASQLAMAMEEKLFVSRAVRTMSKMGIVDTNEGYRMFRRASDLPSPMQTVQKVIDKIQVPPKRIPKELRPSRKALADPDIKKAEPKKKAPSPASEKQTPKEQKQEGKKKLQEGEQSPQKIDVADASKTLKEARPSSPVQDPDSYLNLHHVLNLNESQVKAIQALNDMEKVLGRDTMTKVNKLAMTASELDVEIAKQTKEIKTLEDTLSGIESGLKELGEKAGDNPKARKTIKNIDEFGTHETKQLKASLESERKASIYARNRAVTNMKDLVPEEYKDFTEQAYTFMELGQKFLRKANTADGYRRLVRERASKMEEVTRDPKARVPDYSFLKNPNQTKVSQVLKKYKGKASPHTTNKGLMKQPHEERQSLRNMVKDIKQNIGRGNAERLVDYARQLHRNDNLLMAHHERLQRMDPSLNDDISEATRSKLEMIIQHTQEKINQLTKERENIIKKVRSNELQKYSDDILETYSMLARTSYIDTSIKSIIANP